MISFVFEAFRRGTRLAVSTSALAAFAVASAGAQQTGAKPMGHKHDTSSAQGSAANSPEMKAAQAQMSAGMKMMPSSHMRLTPPRAPNAADSARAAAIVDSLRTALQKYKDVSVAEADGFRMFAPQLKNQPVYHFTKFASAIKAEFAFDPSTPTSLLYKKGADDKMVLVGAMYTAPVSSTPDDLDKRIPLSVAHWHLHSNFCVPRMGERGRWTEVRDGSPVFGPMSEISTREGCDKVNGRFLPTVFNWMVHANVFASDDPKVIWGGEEHEHHK
jgi:hypothetical protein